MIAQRGRRAVLLGVLVLGGACSVGCGEPARAPAAADDDALVGPVVATFSVPDAPQRPYILVVPEGRGPFPLVVGLHPGGARPENFRQLTCADGNPWSGGCLEDLARSAGFVLAMPSGTPELLLDDARTWNAGGGKDGYRCDAGRACEESIDDVAYLDSVVAEVERAVAVDRARVYALGMANGGAMAERLACERSTVYAGVVDVAGGNQVATSPGCFPARPVPVLAIHGDDDPCWGLAAEQSCSKEGVLVSARQSFVDWRARNGCVLDSVDDNAVDIVDLDAAVDVDDGTAAHREDGRGCKAATALVVVEGGGHAWPGGHAYALFDVNGKTSRRYFANALAWEFLDAQRLPDALVAALPPLEKP